MTVYRDEIGEAFAKTQERRIAQEQAAQLEAAQQAERERVELEAARRARLQQEELDNMTPEERAHFEQLNTPQKRVSEVKEIFSQARQKEESDFAEQIEKERQAALLEWRQTHPSAGQHERQMALQKANAAARSKADTFLQERDARELQAERHADMGERLAHSLSERGRVIFSELLQGTPQPAELIQQSKQAVAQTKQSQLQAAYQAEISGKRGTAAMLVRSKYRKLGLPV